MLLLFPGYRKLCNDSKNNSTDATDLWNRPSRDWTSQRCAVHRGASLRTHWPPQQAEGECCLTTAPAVWYMIFDLTKSSAITWESIVWKLLKRRENWLQEVYLIQLWKRTFYSFRNDKTGKSRFWYMRGCDGITSGLAWAPNEEFIRKDELTAEQM